MRNIKLILEYDGTDYAGLGDHDKWSKLQDDMIDAMIRLERALKKHSASLKL